MAHLASLWTRSLQLDTSLHIDTILRLRRPEGAWKCRELITFEKRENFPWQRLRARIYLPSFLSSLDSVALDVCIFYRPCLQVHCSANTLSLLTAYIAICH